MENFIVYIIIGVAALYIVKRLSKFSFKKNPDGKKEGCCGGGNKKGCGCS